MKVKIVKCDWFLGEQPNEGTVSFETEQGITLEAFSYGEEFEEGEEVDVEIDSLDYDLDWEIIFKENPQKLKKLVKSSDRWSYYGYGEILSIDPVKIDFGSIILETGSWTNDNSLVGEYVYWKIDRLDISKS